MQPFFSLALCLLLLLSTFCLKPTHARNQPEVHTHACPITVPYVTCRFPREREGDRECAPKDNLPLIQTHAAATYVTPDGHRTGSLEKGFGEASHCGQLLRRIAGKIVDFLMEVNIPCVAPRGRCHRGQRVAIRVGLVIVRHVQCCVADLQIVMLLCHLSDMFHDTPISVSFSHVFSTFLSYLLFVATNAECSVFAVA